MPSNSPGFMTGYLRLSAPSRDRQGRYEWALDSVLKNTTAQTYDAAPIDLKISHADFKAVMMVFTFMLYFLKNF